MSEPEDTSIQQEGTQPVVRAEPGDGPPPTEAPPAGEAPVVEGTGAGDPLAGVRLNPDAERDEVVPPGGA